MAAHFGILAWRTSWTEEHGGSMGSQRIGHDLPLKNTKRSVTSSGANYNSQDPPGRRSRQPSDANCNSQNSARLGRGTASGWGGGTGEPAHVHSWREGLASWAGARRAPARRAAVTDQTARRSLRSLLGRPRLRAGGWGSGGHGFGQSHLRGGPAWKLQPRGARAVGCRWSARARGGQGFRDMAGFGIEGAVLRPPG